jgi:hypothetical protein
MPVNVHPAEGEWVAWRIGGRAGAKLQLGPVFLGELSYPHDFGLGGLWRAWLNQQHLGFFRSEDEARRRVEKEIVARLRGMMPSLARFRQRAPGPSIGSRFANAHSGIESRGHRRSLSQLRPRGLALR